MGCYVSDRESIALAAASAFTKLGNVHILCNKAGESRVGPIEIIAASDWDWVIGVNLKGFGSFLIQPRARVPCLLRCLHVNVGFAP
jgi:NADP-dependent 3-hydroxy acid dehydrogenase YdfG